MFVVVLWFRLLLVAPLLLAASVDLSISISLSFTMFGWFGGSSAPEWSYPELETPLKVCVRWECVVGLGLWSAEAALNARRCVCPIEQTTISLELVLRCAVAAAWP